LISTVTITLQETIITKIGSAIIKSRVGRVAGSNGSTTPKTEKEPPTGITPQPRSLTEELQQTPSSHAKHSAGARIRGGRISPGAAPTSSKDARLPGGAIFPARRAVPFRVWTVEAVRHVTSAVVGVQVAKACPVAVEGSEAVPVAVAEAAVVAVAEAAGGNYVNISVNNNWTYKGGRDDTSENTN